MNVSGTYRERAAQDMKERRPAETFNPLMRKLVADSRAMMARGPGDARDRARDARAYAVDHLEELHDELQVRLEARGIGYHRATTAEDAIATIIHLLGDARRVPKSKSMVGEEIGLTPALRAAGIDVLETDIGEYIVDIEGRGPSHITAPAVHLKRDRIQELLATAGLDVPDDDPVRLSQAVRDVVGAYFEDCDAAITGANAVIASSGRILVVENEGNVSLGVSHPRKHIVITGLEKVVADEAAALAILEVLAPNATGQALTSFTHFLADPAPGQERHIVFLDNGRSRILADERYRDVLRCIRCSACMNGCPVYRTAGGLSYGSPYMGPIGAVVSPLLWPDGRYADLPYASSLCARCSEACPVGIPLHRMLLDLRSDAVGSGKVTTAERATWKAWAMTYGGALTARAAGAAGRIGLRLAGRFWDRGDEADPRQLPAVDGERDPDALLGDPEVQWVAPDEIPVEPPKEYEPKLDLFTRRAAALGVQVVLRYEPQDGDLELQAVAGIANTGSVLLVGEATARRPLLGAKRVVVHVASGSFVRHPHELVDRLGDAEALILTGASRTADIEKQIVRGIHGSEELLVVVG